jgi:hypothetical protein
MSRAPNGQALGGSHTLCDGVKRASQIFALLDCQHYVGDHHQHCGKSSDSRRRKAGCALFPYSEPTAYRAQGSRGSVRCLSACRCPAVSTKIDVLHQLLWSILIQTFAFSAIASDLGMLAIFGALLTGHNVHAMRESIQLYGYARDAAEQNATFARNDQDPPESQPPNPPLHPTKGSTPLPSTTDGDPVTSREESAALRR